mmetsp:Transcript_20952/g.37420  ORF Transcript_20952/g.37420 Transcript_20952/m.37420 type:complete len:262 (+) Transcript_20952:2754-3539(+)
MEKVSTASKPCADPRPTEGVAAESSPPGVSRSAPSDVHSSSELDCSSSWNLSSENTGVGELRRRDASRLLRFFWRFFFFPVEVVSGGLTTLGFGVGERRNERMMFSRYSSVILLRSRSHSLSSPSFSLLLVPETSASLLLLAFPRFGEPSNGGCCCKDGGTAEPLLGVQITQSIEENPFAAVAPSLTLLPPPWFQTDLEVSSPCCPVRDVVDSLVGGVIKAGLADNLWPVCPFRRSGVPGGVAKTYALDIVPLPCWGCGLA